MGFEWFVASRYLRGVHKGRVRICTAGVTIGVAVLIVVTSVMNGFEKEFLSKMLGAYGHLRLFPLNADRYRTYLPDYETWVERFASRPGVVAVSPVIEQDGMIMRRSPRSRESHSKGVFIRGIDPRYELKVSGYQDLLLAGDWADLLPKDEIAPASNTTYFDPFDVKPTAPAVFLGVEMARSLFGIPEWIRDGERLRGFLEKEVLGKDLTVVVPTLTQGPSPEPHFFSVEVKGVFKTGLYDFDNLYVLTSLQTARILQQMPASPPMVQFLEVRVQDPHQAQRVGLSLTALAEEEYGSFFGALSWTDLNQVLVEAVKIEKVVMATILTLVVLVAAFGISSTLVMTVIEKTREIGTMMAMGARRGSIMAIFVMNGFLVGLFGVAMGAGAGLGICYLIDLLKIRLPGGGEVYVLEYLPVEVWWMDVSFVVIFSLLAATLAGLYPAWKASQLRPVEALGHE